VDGSDKKTTGQSVLSHIKKINVAWKQKSKTRKSGQGNSLGASTILTTLRKGWGLGKRGEGMGLTEKDLSRKKGVTIFVPGKIFQEKTRSDRPGRTGGRA